MKKKKGWQMGSRKWFQYIRIESFYGTLHIRSLFRICWLLHSFFCLLDLLAVGLAFLEVAPLEGVAGELERRHIVDATHLGDD